MKVEITGTAPSGQNIISFRVGVDELEILRGLLTVALQHTPKTSATSKTVQRMQAMVRCLNSDPVAQWIENGNATSVVVSSNPAGGTMKGSCGHVFTEEEEESFGFPLITKGQARDGSPAIDYGTVCKRCLDRANREYPEDVFQTPEDADEWLRSEMK